MPSALDRLKRPFQSGAGREFERYSSPHTHPGGSVWRTGVQKLRVLVAFVARRMTLGSGRREALQELRRRGGSAAGKDVLVIGSGPSAEALDPGEVSRRQENGEIVVVATNYFLHSPLAATITPDYVVWADRAFDPRNPSSEDARAVLVAREGVTLVAPWTWRSTLDTTPLAARTVYFDNDSLEGWTRNISPLRPRGYQGSTGVKALAFALHLTPRTVLIIGIDLSYYRNFEVNEANDILRHPTHIGGADSGTQSISDHSTHGLADALYSTASQFLALRTHFGNRHVVNLDPQSLVDAFPKVASHPFLKKSKKSSS